MAAGHVDRYRDVDPPIRGYAVDALRFVGCSDCTASLERARVRFDAVAGKRYWFQVSGYGTDAGELGFKLRNR